MREVKNRPTSGQFVAVWQYNDKIWSDTYCYRKNELCMWNETKDDFFLIPTSDALAIYNGNAKNIKYFRYK